MATAFLIALITSVAMQMITIRYYERRVERLQDDLDFAVALLAADADTKVIDLGGAA